MSATRLVWLATALYALVYALLGWDRYATYHAGSDLGLFTQSTAAVFAGLSNTTEGGSHFTYHFSPILYLCAPFVLAARSPLALVVLQAIAGALVAPPLFLLARKRMPERLALGVALVALLYPPLAGITFADFHENGFAPAVTVWLAWALAARRFTLAAIFVALALGIKEDQSTILGFGAIALFVWYLRRRDRAGMVFAAGALAASALVFVGFFEVIRPLAGARDVWGPTHFYTWSRIVDPRGSAPWYSIGRPAYALEALVPLLFLPLASPAIVFALPGFAEVLASHESITYTMGQHYAAVWIGYVLVAFALALGRIAASAPRAALRLVRGATVACVLVLALASPTHWGHYLRLPNAHDAVLDRALARLGPNTNVGSFEEVYAHLGFDPEAQLGLERKPRFALLDTTFAHSALEERWRPIVRAGLRTGAYRLLWSHDGIEYYERTGGAAGVPAKTTSDGRGNGAARASAGDREVVARGRREQ